MPVADRGLVREALMALGFTATSPNDDWIDYWLRRQATLAQIIAIALPSRMKKDTTP